MSYHIATSLATSFEEAVERTEAALNAESFGILTRVDVQQTLKSKVDVDFRRGTA